MTIMTSDVPRAADYPFTAPLERYVFAGSGEPPAFSVEGRLPVLALGSNAAPAQLRRKFADLPGHIPVSRAMLFDHVVVYSAHFSRYGSIPATLHEHQGGVAFVALTWLDEQQLIRMHETESLGENYDFVEIADVRLEHDGEAIAAISPVSAPVGAYVSRFGPLQHDAKPIRLAETASSGCPLPALTQPAALRFAHRRVAPDLAFNMFMTRIVEDEAYRRDMSRRLRAH